MKWPTKYFVLGFATCLFNLSAAHAGLIQFTDWDNESYEVLPLVTADDYTRDGRITVNIKTDPNSPRPGAIRYIRFDFLRLDISDIELHFPDETGVLRDIYRFGYDRAGFDNAFQLGTVSGGSGSSFPINPDTILTGSPGNRQNVGISFSFDAKGMSLDNLTRISLSYDDDYHLADSDSPNGRVTSNSFEVLEAINVANTDPTQLIETPTLLLVLAGILGMGWLRRRRQLVLV